MSYLALYGAYAYEVEEADVIGFEYTDEDGETYEEIVVVKSCDTEGDTTTIVGYSEVLNDTETYTLPEMFAVSIMGG